MVILLYGAPAWYDGITSQKQLADIQRGAKKAILRVWSGYRSISYQAAEVIAGIPPVRLLTRDSFERARGRDRRLTQDNTRRDWKTDWERCTKAEWTRRLINNLEIWLDRKHGNVDGYLCKFLSGHGAIRAYLKRRQLHAAETCIFCHKKDTVEHVFCFVGALNGEEVFRR